MKRKKRSAGEANTETESWYDKKCREDPDFKARRAEAAKERRALEKQEREAAVAPAPAASTPAPMVPAADASTSTSPGFLERNIPILFGTRAAASSSSNAAAALAPEPASQQAQPASSSNNVSVPAKNRWWAQLSGTERVAAELLGYDEASWDADGESSSTAALVHEPAVAADAGAIEACHRCWEQLTADEQKTVGSLGFKQWSWDASVMDLDGDIDPRISFPHGRRAKRFGRLNLAGSILVDVDAVIGMRFHNPVDMTVQQREGPLDEAVLEPCFLVRGQFQGLGFEESDEKYTATRWVSFEDVAYCVRDEHGRFASDEYQKIFSEFDALFERLFKIASDKAQRELRADFGEAALPAATYTRSSPRGSPSVEAAVPPAAAPTAMARPAATAAAPRAAPPAAATRSPRRAPALQPDAASVVPTPRSTRSSSSPTAVASPKAARKRPMAPQSRS